MTMIDPPVTSADQLSAIIERISFDRSSLDFNWEFRFRPITLQFDDDPTNVRVGWMLWAEFLRPDIRDGEIGIGRGRDEILWFGASESAAVKTCWMLFRQIMEHEQLEAFRYEGVQLFNPHNTVRELMLPAQQRDRQDKLDAYALDHKR